MANDVTSKVILGLDPSEFRRGIQQVDAQLKQTSRLFGNLGQIIGASFAVAVIQDFTAEAIRLGSELQTVRQGFARFGDEQQLQKLRTATRGLVSDLELMKVSVQAGNFGIPIEQMANLLAFATRRAAETGQEVDYLVQSIVTGIGRKSPLILDNLGISVTRLKEKFNGAALEAQSIADVSRAVGDIAAEELGKMGGAVDTAADKMTRLSTSWTNMKTSIGESLAGPLASAIDWAMELTFYFQTLMSLLSSLQVGARQANQALGIGGSTKPAAAATKAQPATATVQDPVRSISLLRENLKALEQEYENVAIGSARFYELRRAIEQANYQMGRATGEIWSGAKQGLIELDAKGLTPVTNELTSQNMVLRSSVIPAYDELTKMIKGAREQLELEAQQLQFASAVGAEFGVILSSAFTAAMNNGTSFFDELQNAIKNYVQQLAVAVATTLALSAIVSAFTGAPLGVAFRGVAQGTGLGGLFGEGGILNMNARVSGSDLLLGTQRSGTNYGRIGG